jgi:hypothetical protein
VPEKTIDSSWTSYKTFFNSKVRQHQRHNSGAHIDPIKRKMSREQDLYQFRGYNDDDCEVEQKFTPKENKIHNE